MSFLARQMRPCAWIVFSFEIPFIQRHKQWWGNFIIKHMSISYLFTTMYFFSQLFGPVKEDIDGKNDFQGWLWSDRVPNRASFRLIKSTRRLLWHKIEELISTCDNSSSYSCHFEMFALPHFFFKSASGSWKPFLRTWFLWCECPDCFLVRASQYQMWLLLWDREGGNLVPERFFAGFTESGAENAHAPTLISSRLHRMNCQGNTEQVRNGCADHLEFSRGSQVAERSFKLHLWVRIQSCSPFLKSYCDYLDEESRSSAFFSNRAHIASNRKNSKYAE